MWEHVGVVELFHGIEREIFVGVSEAVHVWLELFDDGVDVVMVFEVVLHEEAEQLGFWVSLEDFGSDCELYGLCGAGVEDGVDGFGVEVGDEVGKL
jgi:hypothetical protein